MDVFVSPSSDEAFGLAVLEALAAGLPALHVTCPAIDDLLPEEAPGARRIGTGVPELTALLCEFQKAGPVRLPVPPVVERYDIARSAERLMAVYRAATGAPQPQLPAAAPSAATPVPAPTSLPLTSR
jgi:glycosyltransferase involved in cell wall biosynthesis